jgi:hypothetical protein
MSSTTYSTNEQFRPARRDEQLVSWVSDDRLDILNEEVMNFRVVQAVAATERHANGLARNGMYPTVNIAELAEQNNMVLQEDIATAAELVMYPDDMISRNPLPRHNEYIDTINGLDPKGKPVTPATDIDHIRAEVERAADAVIAQYAQEGINEMTAFLAMNNAVKG